MFDKENLISLAMFISFRIVLVHPLVDFICVVRWKILIVEKVFSSKSMNCLMSPSNFDAFWLKVCICFSQNFRFLHVTNFLLWNFLIFSRNFCIFSQIFSLLFREIFGFFFHKIFVFPSTIRRERDNFSIINEQTKNENEAKWSRNIFLA